MIELCTPHYVGVSPPTNIYILICL